MVRFYRDALGFAITEDGNVGREKGLLFQADAVAYCGKWLIPQRAGGFSIASPSRNGGLPVDRTFSRWYSLLVSYLQKQIGKELKSMIVREVTTS